MAAVASIAVVLSLATVYRMGKGFLPSFDEGAAQVNLFLKPGASLASSTQVRKMADERFAKLLCNDQNPKGPLLWYTCKTGRAENDEHVMGVNTSEYVMSLNPDSGLSREALIETLSDSISDMAGVEVEVEQPIAHLISHMLSGVTAEIAIKIYGDDLRELIKLAENAKEVISEIDGLADPVVQPIDFVRQVQVSVRRDQLARYGLSVASVHRFLETAYNGRVVSRIVDGQRVFDLVVKFNEDLRQDVDLLERLPIEFADGNRVPLGELADVRMAEAPNEINRENARRMIVVRVNTRGKPLSTAVQEIKQVVASEVDLPEGYTAAYAGQFEAQESATRRLLLFSCLALAGVFVVLYSTFSSTNLVLQILLALPIAFAGGVAAITLTGQELNVASMVGFISLGGIAARNGILLIETYLARIGEGVELRDAVVLGSLDRIAPVLMTALTTGIGLMPLVIGGHLPGKEILFPVATVIVGGLITSTAAEFLLRPGLFLRLYREAQVSSVK
jgi:Cu/Ag efflux pump CusA